MLRSLLLTKSRSSRRKRREDVGERELQRLNISAQAGPQIRTIRDTEKISYDTIATKICTRVCTVAVRECESARVRACHVNICIYVYICKHKFGTKICKIK